MSAYSAKSSTNSCHNPRKTSAIMTRSLTLSFINDVNGMSRQKAPRKDFLTIYSGDSASTFFSHLSGLLIHFKCSNLYFRPLKSDIAMAVREVRGVHLGKLITVRGIVTRVSEVKPLLLVNAYTCDVCGSETFQDISNKQFTPIVDCQNPAECLKNGVQGSLHMQTRACRFSPFQEVKIQEMVI